MPTNKEIASDLWLHLNSPESLDKIVGDRIAQLRRDDQLDELTDFQNERKEIDDAVEKYLTSPAFEKYREVFREIDDKDSPELERAVAEMGHEIRHGMSQKGREESMDQIDQDLEKLGPALEQGTEIDEPEYEQ